MNTNPFSDIPPTPAEHFKLLFYAAVLHVIEQTSSSFESRDDMLKRFPFLIGYQNELAERGLDGRSTDEASGLWQGWLQEWEKSAEGHLPLRALQAAAGLDHHALTLFLCLGLIEEEQRFGPLFEALHGVAGQHRPTQGLLNNWWSGVSEQGDGRSLLRLFQELGLVKVLNPETPQSEWTFQVPGALWDLARGQALERPAPWLHYLPAEKLHALETQVLPESVCAMMGPMPSLLRTGEARALIVRGPRNNGRKTLVGSVARELGLGLLLVRGLQKPDDERWSMVGPAATALGAMPLIGIEPAPGESFDIPALKCYDGPLGIVLGKQGGITGPGVESALALTLEIPDSEVRRRHWAVASVSRPLSDPETISERFRITSGHIRRATPLAASRAALAGRSSIELSDVREACRALNRQSLDSLATRIEVSGDWGQLAVSERTEQELRILEVRCRNREHLHKHMGPGLDNRLNAGVRALFTGPSGTGKTLAAKLLASVLGKDLYRADLSATVNKYIGETEKNLNRLFSRAEEQDVILLLDEGDALLTQRTAVQTSNDRYANLETNFLLQRMESYEGIVVITTNAGSRIDSAFQRRIDAVVEFRPPDIMERWTIWQLHLSSDHDVDHAFLEEVAGECALSGGQIRNAALHATLLALNDGRKLATGHLELAVQREYRKMGSVCPLRGPAAAYRG